MEAYVLQVFTTLLCIVCIAKCVQTSNCTCWGGEDNNCICMKNYFSPSPPLLYQLFLEDESDVLVNYLIVTILSSLGRTVRLCT